MTPYKKHREDFFAKYKNAKENPNYTRLLLITKMIDDMELEIKERKKECTDTKIAIAKARYESLVRGHGIPTLTRHIDMLQAQFISIATRRLLAPEKVISPRDPKLPPVRKSSPESSRRSKSLNLGLASFEARVSPRKLARHKK